MEPSIDNAAAESEGSATPNLASLPSELLIEIFSYLEPTPSNIDRDSESESKPWFDITNNLRDVALACRRFHDLAKPLMLAHIICHPYYLGLLTHGHDDSSPPASDAFGHVKAVVFDGECRYFTEKWPFRHFLDVEDVAEELDLKNMWPEDAYYKIQAIYEEEAEESDDYDFVYDYETAFERADLPCLTPHVEEIVFESSSDDMMRTGLKANHNYYTLEPIILASAGVWCVNVHKFERLRYLSVDVQYINMTAVSNVFLLPSLQHLVIEGRNWDLDEWDISNLASVWGEQGDWECPQGASNIEKLEFRHAAFT